MSEDNRKNTIEDSTSKDNFFKRNKKIILYATAIMLPIITIIVMIGGRSATTKSVKEDIINKSSQDTSSFNSMSGNSTSFSSSNSTSSSSKSYESNSKVNKFSSSTSKSNSNSSKSSSSTSKSYSNNNKSYSNKSKSSSAKARKSAEDYDAGYNAIYEDDDYSQSKYNKNKDYAMGVDDAIDDLDWE